ncbi:D-glycerate dehydrogenase [bacterium]|nr:D-glycerate dehydrogenase [bacterium]
MPKVLITREIPQAGINILEQYPELKLDYRKGPPLSEAKLLEAIKDVDAILPVIPDTIDKKVINAGKKLKVIATYSVGFSRIDVETATKKKIFVANTPGNLTESVAEHVIALMLSVGKHTAIADKFCRDGKYKYWDPMLFVGPKFMNETIGIIGFGRIGQQVARIAKHGFNMKVLYNDVIQHGEAENLLDAKKVDLDTLLQNSDIISINCNLCESTHHLIGERELKKMKPFGILINTARGPVVNEEALVNALEENWILGAGIDVYENEPEIHPTLKKLENVVLTPHIASSTWEARIQMARMAAENIVDVLINNKPPRYIVNKELSKNYDNISSIA